MFGIPVQFAIEVIGREEVRHMVDDRSILVTGAAGQLGSVGRIRVLRRIHNVDATANARNSTFRIDRNGPVIPGIRLYNPSTHSSKRGKPAFAARYIG